jgi:hypothetical protein
MVIAALSAVMIGVSGWTGTTVGLAEALTARQYKVINACTLLTVAEVKELAPWPAALDQMKVEEEPLGKSGSACEYPSVGVQVMAFNQGTIDALRKGAVLEPVSGIGDAAWARNNQSLFAELLVRSGDHLLTLQTSIPAGSTFERVKPTLLALGRAFAARLR